MTFVIRYVETADEVLEELDFIRHRRPDANASDILRQYAPLYLCRSRRPDEPYDLCGTEWPLLDSALEFDSADTAAEFINSLVVREAGEYVIKEM